MLLAVPKMKSVWVDFGCGTGYNLEIMNSQGKLNQFSKIYIVDLSKSLLEKAKQRVINNSFNNVESVEADACTWRPQEKQVDLITFSYSLTMIPDWFLALENAFNILSPNGIITIVDFYVSRKYPREGMKYHNWFTRTFWQLYFAFDNVYLNADHLPFLKSHFEEQTIIEKKSPVPYVKFLKIPFYIFLGRKPSLKKD